MNTIELVKDVLLRSGASWVLWLLGLLSLVSVAIIVERFLHFRSLGLDLKTTAERLDAKLTNGDFAGAIDELKRTASVAGSIAAAGLRLADRGPAAVEKAMQSAVALERAARALARLPRHRRQQRAVRRALRHRRRRHRRVRGARPRRRPATAGAAAASQVATQAVMASIAEALVATAVGILVALPAVAAYNYFQRRIALAALRHRGALEPGARVPRRACRRRR